MLVHIIYLKTYVNVVSNTAMAMIYLSFDIKGL